MVSPGHNRNTFGAARGFQPVAIVPAAHDDDSGLTDRWPWGNPAPHVPPSARRGSVAPRGTPRVPSAPMIHPPRRASRARLDVAGAGHFQTHPEIA